ncbi:unnamed protein product, partial [Medioppia subpectinata]
RYLHMSSEDKRKQYKCGNNYKTLDDILTWNQYSRLNQIHNKFSTSDFVFSKDINDKVSVFIGDITALEIDAIVNAANQQLKGGGGGLALPLLLLISCQHYNHICISVDGAIHSAAGRQLLQSECQTLGGCPTGSSKMTGGYQLPAKYVIHTVGPVGAKPPLLQSCYRSALDLMSSSALKSIAFPCISTGVYGYPNEDAAHIALSTVRKWLDSSPDAKDTQRIIFCLFLRIDIDIYHKLMPIYFPLQ